MGDLVVGLDIGTHKITTIVGEVRPEDIYIVGLGIEPSDGMKKGVVDNISALSTAISKSVRRAEKSSGLDIGRAYVSVSGSHIDSRSSRGVATIVGSRTVQAEDVEKALSVARSIDIPHSREILHVVPRSYTVDSQEGVINPIGMHCFRLEVDAHIITASTTSLANLEDAVESAGLLVDRFVLNPLAAGDAVLTVHEREMGAVVIDIGGGTTDLAIFIDGTVWHTAVIPHGGNDVTDDITHWMRVPFGLAEQVKLQKGHADANAVAEDEVFPVEPFGGEIMPVSRQHLAQVIEMCYEDIFEAVQIEIMRSGYSSQLRAGAIITGGGSQMPGYRDIASRSLKLPVRLAQPEKITGIADALKNPSYSTSVGLLRVGLELSSVIGGEQKAGPGIGLPVANWSRRMKEMFYRFLPQDD